MKDIRCKAGGFTLIELSVVIVILGLLSAGIIAAYSVYMQKEQTSRTQRNIEAVNDAIASFVAENGYLPCPASPDDAASRATNCGDGGTSVSPVMARVGAGGGLNVRIGVVPVSVNEGVGVVRQLVPGEKAIDGWNNRLAYAVVEEMAVPGNGRMDQDGAITIRNSGGGNATTTARYIVLSHGQDGAGAYSRAGLPRQPCAAGSGGLNDIINCDNLDATFVSIGNGGTRSTSGDANNFDDFVMSDTSASGINGRYECTDPNTVFSGVNFSTRRAICTPRDPMTCTDPATAFAGLIMDPGGSGRLVPDCRVFSQLCPAGQVRVADNAGGSYCANNTQGSCPAGEVQVGMLNPVDANGDGIEDTTLKAIAFGGAPDCRNIVSACNSTTEIQVGTRTNASGALEAICAPRQVGSPCTGANVMIGSNPDGSPQCAPVPTCPNGQYIFGLVSGVLQCSRAVGDSGCGPGEKVTGISNGVVSCAPDTGNSFPSAPLRSVFASCPPGWSRESVANVYAEVIKLPGGTHSTYSEMPLIFSRYDWDQISNPANNIAGTVGEHHHYMPTTEFCRTDTEYSTYVDINVGWAGDNCPPGWDRIGFIPRWEGGCAAYDANNNCQYHTYTTMVRCAK